MLPMLLAAFAAPAAALPALPARTAACLPPVVRFAAPSRSAPRARKLGELPPATEYLAVARHVGGCPAPAVVRTGIGAR